MTQLTGYDMTVGVKRSVTQSMPSYYHLFNLHFISFVNFFQSWFVIQATVHVTFFFKDVNINSPSSLPYSFYSLYNQTILCPLKFFLSSYHIPAFRCFKVNSYFVGTCKRKIRVEQVKSPKNTLFVCLFFHWIFSFPNIFTSTPTLDILLKLVFRYIRLETFDSFSQYFLLSAVINFSIALFFPVLQLVINDSFICGLLLFQLLFDTWVKAHRWYKMQPLDHIR